MRFQDDILKSLNSNLGSAPLHKKMIISLHSSDLISLSIEMMWKSSERALLTTSSKPYLVLKLMGREWVKGEDDLL